MPRKGRRRKKTRTHVVENEAAASALVTQEEMKVPHSLVVSERNVTAFCIVFSLVLCTMNCTLCDE
jgi:hypothetical protein